MKKTTPADWQAALKAVGISSGDTVMAHTSLPAFGFIEGGPQGLTQASLDAVGAQGTWVMPTFTLGFCRSRIFERETTPSEMGVWTEIFRKNNGALRNLHPIHSVTAIGHQARALSSSWSLSSFGKKSAYEVLHELNAWFLCAGVGAERLTFIHYVEETKQVPYRGYKAYPGTVRSEGREDPHTYTMYSRDTRFKMDLKRWHEILKDLGLGKEIPLAYGTLTAYRARETFDAVSKLLDKDPGALLEPGCPLQELIEGKIECAP